MATSIEICRQRTFKEVSDNEIFFDAKDSFYIIRFFISRERTILIEFFLLSLRSENNHVKFDYITVK